MCNKRYTYFIFCLLFVLLNSCSEYQQVLKSKDYEYKYEKALTYFNAKKYARAQVLLDEVSTYFRGTAKNEDVVIYTARCHMAQKQYENAAEYYQAYIRNYPKGNYIVEARFSVGHAYYLDAPDARLDQENTRNAIKYFTEFVELYPESEYANQAYGEMGEMYNKLAYKELLNARLYYNLGSYLGNNYESCQIVAKNALSKYPSNDYQEELNWLVFLSKYQEMLISVEEKKMGRATEAEDEFYNFTSQFPDSKYQNKAQKMGNNIRKILNNETKIDEKIE